VGSVATGRSRRPRRHGGPPGRDRPRPVRPETFRKAWPSLLRGYAIDAILEERPHWEPLTRFAASTRLHDFAAQAVVARQEVPGVGEYYTVRGPGVVGGIARHRGRVVHAALFPSARP